MENKYGAREYLSARDKHELNRAIEAAKTSKCNQKHGAVIKAGGRILAVEVNRKRNDPTIVADPKREAAVHAEIAALRSCGNTSVAGGTIYVARWGKKNKPLMSKPCERCQAALREAGIKKVIYTISNFMEF